MRAIGDDDHIERAVACSGLVDDVCVCDIDDLRRRDQAYRGTAETAVQQVEQRAAADAEAMRRRMQVGVTEIEHGAAAMRLAFEAVDARAALQRLLGEAENAQHREPGRLQQQPRPQRAGLGKALEERDPVTCVRQQRRGGLAGDAAADDTDLEDPIGHGPIAKKRGEQPAS